MTLKPAIKPNFLFPEFPKARSILPPAYKEIYKLHYKRNRDGDTSATSISKQMELWLHKKVAEDVLNTSKDLSTLEIGAGTLNQLIHEPNVKNYDIIEPFKELFKGAKELYRINTIYDDISEIPLNKKYGRITSVATFEHILNLPEVVAKAILHMKPGSCMRTSIPNEGTIMWKLGTKITGYEFEKMYGLEYDVLMQHEHVNTAKEIESILDYFFDSNDAYSFGLNKNFSFYRFIESKEPDYAKAKQFLESINATYLLAQ